MRETAPDIPREQVGWKTSLEEGRRTRNATIFRREEFNTVDWIGVIEWSCLVHATDDHLREMTLDRLQAVISSRHLPAIHRKFGVSSCTI